MSIERAEGYIEALAQVRAAIRLRLNEGGISNDGKLELLDLLSMLDDMLKSRQLDDTEDRPPEPLSGSF